MSRVHLIPLCTAHELRRDFSDLIAAAQPLPARAEAEPLWAALPDGFLDSLLAPNPPGENWAFTSRLSQLAPRARSVLLIAASAIQEVAAELPAVDALAANLRFLLRGDTLAAGDHSLIGFDDWRHPCIGWVGDWQQTAPLLARLHRLSSETVPVLICGETGTGKEVIARALHRLGSRSRRPLLAINCAELPESILEGELFGHVRGAFTGASHDRAGLFEAAADGTVFLDEIGELPVPAQAKLLRILEEHQVRRLGSSRPTALRCRIITATNRELAKEIEHGRFRSDLFYRLRGTEIRLKPLRERSTDILPLAELFAARAALRFRRCPVELSAEAKLLLFSHRWPGNVRELRQTIEVAVLAATDSLVNAEHLNLVPEPVVAPAQPLLTARAVERAHILRALVSTAGNKGAAARILGLSRQSLLRRLRRHGIAAASEKDCPQTDGMPGNDLPPRAGSRLAKEIR